MKTKVIMKRQILGHTVRQDSKIEYLSATDLARIGNKWRESKGLSRFDMSQYLKGKATTELINELEKEYDCIPILKGRGRNSNTMVHPLLFVDIALAIHPTLKIKVYNWLLDNLIQFRNESGDSYKAMSSALFQNSSNTARFFQEIRYVALEIKQACKVDDWQKAKSYQLELRNTMHKNITLLANVLGDNARATEQGIKQAIKSRNKALEQIT